MNCLNFLNCPWLCCPLNHHPEINYYLDLRAIQGMPFYCRNLHDIPGHNSDYGK